MVKFPSPDGRVKPDTSATKDEPVYQKKGKKGLIISAALLCCFSIVLVFVPICYVSATYHFTYFDEASETTKSSSHTESEWITLPEFIGDQMNQSRRTLPKELRKVQLPKPVSRARIDKAWKELSDTFPDWAGTEEAKRKYQSVVNDCDDFAGNFTKILRDKGFDACIFCSYKGGTNHAFVAVIKDGKIILLDPTPGRQGEVRVVTDDYDGDGDGQIEYYEKPSLEQLQKACIKDEYTDRGKNGDFLLFGTWTSREELEKTFDPDKAILEQGTLAPPTPR